MNFTDKNIEEYAAKHTKPESGLLHKLNRQTHLEVLNPRMLSGHLQGRILSQYAKMLRPKNVLEIGTYTGYSALCIAEGLADGGKIHTVDANEELKARCLTSFKDAGFENQIEMHIGNALDVLKNFTQTWDLVFIDADKSNYINYYNAIIEQVRSGGLIIADNVLWSSKVLLADENLDADTKTLKAFNQLVQQDERVENVLLPVRDGLMVCLKK